MENVEIQPHIKVSRDETHPVAIVVGDPCRAKLLASLCEESREIAYNREYRTFDCQYKGQSFLVTSHGIGSSGALICFEELIANGTKVIIRAGTAGSLQPQTIRYGDVVVCYAACREEGASNLLAPKGYPAVADPYVFQTLQNVANAKSKKIKYGVALSTSAFYRSPVLPCPLELFSKARVDVVEMEMSALFVIARLKGIKAGALCLIDGYPLGWNVADKDKSETTLAEGKQLMLEIARDVAIRIAAEKNW